MEAVEKELRAVINLLRIARARDIGQVTEAEYEEKLRDLAAFIGLEPRELERTTLCRVASACGPWAERAVYHHLQDFLDEVIEIAQKAGWRIRLRRVKI